MTTDLCFVCGNQFQAGTMHACPGAVHVPALGPKSTKILEAIEGLEAKLLFLAEQSSRIEAKVDRLLDTQGEAAAVVLGEVLDTALAQVAAEKAEKDKP